MTEVGDVIDQPGASPLRVCGVMNAHWLVTPASEHGPVEMLAHDEAQAYGLPAPESGEDQRQQQAEREREQTAETIAAWARVHPEFRRAERLRAKYGNGPREGSAEWVFQQIAEGKRDADDSG